MQSDSGRSMVIDSNMLQDGRLRSFFQRSIRNRAVLPDYSAIEAHKGDTLQNIYRNMEILSEFSSQVVVLKNTQPICGLKGRVAASRENLISWSLTTEFAKFCRAIAEAKAGNQSYQKQLLEKGRDADIHMDWMLSDSSNLPPLIDEVSRIYTPSELLIIRNDEPFTLEMLEKSIRIMMTIYGNWSDAHPYVTRDSKPHEIHHTLIFRCALCAHLLTLWWIAVGGAKSVRPEKLRNDMVDIMFAAYATYFDGLLTADKKAAHIYRRASLFLKEVFGTRHRSSR